MSYENFMDTMCWKKKEKHCFNGKLFKRHGTCPYLGEDRILIFPMMVQAHHTDR